MYCVNQTILHRRKLQWFGTSETYYLKQGILLSDISLSGLRFVNGLFLEAHKHETMNFAGCMRRLGIEFEKPVYAIDVFIYS